MATLKIVNLHATIEDKEILKGINLTINSGEVHALLGPNGTGKSTLASVIMGNPRYTVTKGEIYLDDKNVLEMSVDERARAGIFLAFQNPIEVPGVTNNSFMRESLSAIKGERVKLIEFALEYEKMAEELDMKNDLPHRYLNEGFSGGEKKRNEILQMKVLKPKFALLDEIDSGLDVDALRIVGENVSQEMGPNLGILIITHYQRMLNYIKPSHVHVISDGKIVLSGGIEIVNKIEEEGYNWGFIRGAWSSVANVSIALMQDFLNLGNETRVNLPSTLGDNWKWRIKEGSCTTELADKIYRYTKMYGRCK